MKKLVVFLCKGFAKIVEASRNGRQILLETWHTGLEGEFTPTGDFRLSRESSRVLRALLAAGYTVTAYISHEDVHVPFADAVEFAVAECVNAAIWLDYGDQIILP